MGRLDERARLLLLSLSLIYNGVFGRNPTFLRMLDYLVFYTILPPNRVELFTLLLRSVPVTSVMLIG